MSVLNIPFAQFSVSQKDPVFYVPTEIGHIWRGRFRLRDWYLSVLSGETRDHYVYFRAKLNDRRPVAEIHSILCRCYSTRKQVLELLSRGNIDFLGTTVETSKFSGEPTKVLRDPVSSAFTDGWFQFNGSGWSAKYLGFQPCVAPPCQASLI